ncbi:retrovirus-related pol polyprotein from transposon TNT 1-94 [Tanacetum coccineum]
MTSQPKSSRSVNSSKHSQDSKPNEKNPDSSKLVRPKPLQKPKLKCEFCNYTNHSTDDCYRILYCMKCKRENHRTSDHDMYIASLRSSQNYKAQPYQYASPFKQILKPKAKPYPPCTHCGFNGQLPDDLDTSESPFGTWTVDAQGFNDCFQDLSHKYCKGNKVLSINKLGKKSKVLGLPSLVYSKDKPCSAYEKGMHKRAFFKTKQNFSIKKYLHLLNMDLFRPVSPMSINHEKYTLVIINEYSRYTWVYFLKNKSQTAEMIMSFIKMVKNKNDVNVKQIRTDNRTEFRNTRLESFYDEKGISQNFSSPYTPEQNGIAERKTKTLIEAARTILNGSVLSKHLWTEVVRIACYTQNRSIIVKRHDRTLYKIFRERIPDINYFHIFGCLSFRVFNTKRQQIKETYHVTSDERIEVIRFTNTSVDEIGIGDLSRYPPDEFLQEDDPSRQYQTNSDISYYIIPHGRLLTELTQEKHVSEVIALNEQDNPKTEDVECNAPT